MHIDATQDTAKGPENKNGEAAATAPPKSQVPITKPEPADAAESNTRASQVTPETPPGGGDIFDQLAAAAPPDLELVPSLPVLASLEVRKPKRDEWVRCHPTRHVRVSAYIADGGGTYILASQAAAAIPELVTPVDLCLTATIGVYFLWALKIPTEDRRVSAWVEAFQAAETARSCWVRIAWQGGHYCVHRRQVDLPEPEWPVELSNASDLLRLASRLGSLEVIDSPDHPVIRELRGLA